jgi:hypothetical protein
MPGKEEKREQWNYTRAVQQAFYSCRTSAHLVSSWLSLGDMYAHNLICSATCHSSSRLLVSLLLNTLSFLIFPMLSMPAAKHTGHALAETPYLLFWVSSTNWLIVFALRATSFTCHLSQIHAEHLQCIVMCPIDSHAGLYKNILGAKLNTLSSYMCDTSVAVHRTCSGRRSVGLRCHCLCLVTCGLTKKQ